MPSTAIAVIHRDEIIKRVADGEYLASIARSLGLAGKGQAISNALAHDPDYQIARVDGLAAKLQRREEEMEQAKREDVPRARELLGHARWRAEREAPEVWGAKTELRVSAVIDDDAGLAAAARELLGVYRRGRVVEDEGDTDPPALPTPG